MSRRKKQFETMLIRVLLLTGILVLLLVVPEERAAATPAASLTMFRPNGGEVWNVGTQETIIWGYSELSGDVRLEYSTNGGLTWKTIVAAIQVTTANYDWTVPDDPSDNVYVRVSSLSEPAVGDVNNAPFTIYKQYTFADSYAQVMPAHANGGDTVAYTVVIYEENSATMALTNPLPTTLTILTNTLQVEPGWKNSAQYAGGQITWSDLVTSTTPVHIKFSAQVTGATATLVITNPI